MLIGELSRRTGVNAHQLRYYESQGLLEPSRRTNGYRSYDSVAVQTVNQIKKLLGAGLSTEEIAYLLPCATGTAPSLEPCPELLTTLRGRLRRLDEHMSHLARTRESLNHYIETTEKRGSDEEGPRSCDVSSLVGAAAVRP